MIIVEFIKTFFNQLIDFFGDFRIAITKVLSDIHHFLNRFMPDDVILLFLIAIGAFITIAIFRAIINRD